MYTIYIPTYIHTYIQTDRQTDRQTYIHTYIHTYRVMVRSGAAGAEVPQTEHGKFESKFMAPFV